MVRCSVLCFESWDVNQRLAHFLPRRRFWKCVMHFCNDWKERKHFQLRRFIFTFKNSGCFFLKRIYVHILTWLAFDKKAISFEDDIEIGIWEIFWSYSILLWQVLSRILIRRDLWTQILSWKRASKNFSFMNKTEAFTQKTFQNPPSNLVQDPIKTLRQDTLKPLKTFSRPFVKKKK